jgi:hypothetical protein
MTTKEIAVSVFTNKQTVPLRRSRRKCALIIFTSQEDRRGRIHEQHIVLTAFEFKNYFDMSVPK